MTADGSYWPPSRAGVSSALPSTKTTSCPASAAIERSSVDLPVPGGPSRTTCRLVRSATARPSRSRRSPMTGVGVPAVAGAVLPRVTVAFRSASSSVCPALRRGPRPAGRGPVPRAGSGHRRGVVADDAADVLAVLEVLVALVDLVEGVRAGDQLVELEVAGLVERDHQRDVVERVAGSEQAALHRLLEQRQLRAVQLDVHLGRVGQAGDDDGAALADGAHRVADHLRVDDADGDDRLVRADPAGETLE